MYLLILLITTAFAGINETTCSHTNVFLERGNSNEDNFYFVRQTYLYGTTFDKCYAMTGNDNSEYRKYISDSIQCQGKWCVNKALWPNGWNCPNKQCYEVEHIIPKKNNIPEFQNCNVNIFGNLVMAYGLWNSQLQNKFLCEKQEIYGDIYDQAYQTIKSCCGIAPNSDTTGIIILACVWIAVVILTILLMVGYYSKNNNNDHSEFYGNI